MFEDQDWMRAETREADAREQAALRQATRSLFGGDDFWGREKLNPNPPGPVRPFRLKREAGAR